MWITLFRFGKAARTTRTTCGVTATNTIPERPQRRTAVSATSEGGRGVEISNIIYFQNRAGSQIFVHTGLRLERQVKKDMPGPMPKDPAIRQRTNKSATRALLRPDFAPRVRAPKLPDLPDGEAWHEMALQFWKAVWSSPVHFEFLRADEPALFRLVVLVNAFWNTGKLEFAKEIRLLEREFGLTPLSRRRLEWSVAQAEEAKDRHEQRRSRRAVIIDGDPRKVLDE
jgi:hypothetical protein